MLATADAPEHFVERLVPAHKLMRAPNEHYSTRSFKRSDYSSRAFIRSKRKGQSKIAPLPLEEKLTHLKRPIAVERNTPYRSAFNPRQHTVQLSKKFPRGNASMCSSSAKTANAFRYAALKPSSGFKRREIATRTNKLDPVNLIRTQRM